MTHQYIYNEKLVFLEFWFDDKLINKFLSFFVFWNVKLDRKWTQKGEKSVALKKPKRISIVYLCGGSLTSCELCPKVLVFTIRHCFFKKLPFTESYISGRWVNCKIMIKPYLTLFKNLGKNSEVIFYLLYLHNSHATIMKNVLN